ncbi:MAG: CoA transferase [Gammaproteobacteria bacterium]|nr:CoA transferase [Gammaproteobacteria bacterium]MDH5260366.1 CoA transferase [Gammaproteobacteria bacterium]MDH5583430.1 CoA transferase [Gammaproteobacteria bacterium]
MSAPLENIRVLDMSRVLAGPWAGQLLGDYGADVVKIERPECGDDTRQWGPPWLDDSESVSAYFLSANRNKRSVTVNIAAGAGQALIRELAAEADVLLENYKIGTLARYGLGPDELLKLNPRLIYCSISAFGQTGSRASEPGYDAMIQASAGLMSITGSESGGPQKVGVAISDIMAGMYATTAILAALNARAESGRGQHIDVPLYDSQVAWLANQNMNFLISGTAPARMGTAHPNLVPYQAFETRDGNLMLTVGNDRQFRSCCDVFELPQIKIDPRFATMKKRIQNRDLLIPILQSRLKERESSEWLALLLEQGVPAGPVNDIAEVLSNQHARERNLVRQIRNSENISVPTVSNPVEFAETPVCYEHAPPALGEHTNEVLREWLGYSDARIDALRKNAVI